MTIIFLYKIHFQVRKVINNKDCQIWSSIIIHQCTTTKCYRKELVLLHCWLSTRLIVFCTLFLKVLVTSDDDLLQLGLQTYATTCYLSHKNPALRIANRQERRILMQQS